MNLLCNFQVGTISNENLHSKVLQQWTKRNEGVAISVQWSYPQRYSVCMHFPPSHDSCLRFIKI
jgi:hypothetical protein